MHAKAFLGCLLLIGIRLQTVAEPNITAQPNDQSVSLGATVKLRVTAGTTHAPIRYQWRLFSTPLPTKTSSTLTLTNVQLAMAGDYDVVLTDSIGSITSRVAHLSVDPTFIKITTGAIVTDGGFGFGCAWGDYDGDGYIDLFVCNFPDVDGNQHDFLYHNTTHGTFDRVTNVPMVNANAWATGASWGDYDNDGRLDLFVSRPGNSGSGPNTLYHNQGGGKFQKIINGPMVTQSMTSHSGIWADFDNDGWLDVFVANFRPSGSTQPASDNYLYYNIEGTSFQPVSFGTKSLHNGDSFDCSAADFNNDGWIDLVVAQGVGTNQQNNLLYANTKSRTFLLQTNSVVFTKLANSGSAAWGDYDNDGFLDLFLSGSNNSSQPETFNILYHNNGDGTFSWVTNSIVGQEAASSTGCAWGDYDNDGWLDLFVCRVGRYDVDFNVTNPENNCLYHNNGDGQFTKITTGSLVNESGYSFGCAWGDYDNDGFIDLFVSNGFVQTSANNFLYRNSGNSNHWINIKLEGTASNRAAIGAKVRVKATIGGQTFWQMREISGGSGHGSQNDMRAHFGLGDAEKIEVLKIEWPSGIVQEFHALAAQQFLTVTEPPQLKILGLDSAGAAQFLLQGVTQRIYEIQQSIDLSVWTPLTQITNVSRTMQFTDSASKESTQRYFRALEVQQ